MRARLLLLICLLAGAAHAAEPAAPVVRLTLEPDTVEVGEAAELRVTVLGPTWFPAPPVFPSFEVPNAIVRRPPDRSGPITETVGGERWSGVYRTYEVYPLIGARFTLGGESMRITVANPGADSVVADQPVPQATLTAVVPAGAESLDPYLAGERLTFRRELETSLAELKAGDAVVLRYVAELVGMPAIFLPPLAPEVTAGGVSSYADEPVLEEGAASRRTEQVTLVLNHGGEVVLPSVSLRWWNRAAGRIEEATIEALTFQVAGPVAGVDMAAEGQEIDWRMVVALAFIVTCGAWFARRVLPGWRQWALTERARRLESEAHAFSVLKRACNGADARLAYAALLRWQRKLFPESDLRQLAESTGRSQLVAQLDALSAHLYGEGEGDLQLATLAGEVGELRTQTLAEQTRNRQRALPALNPGGVTQ